MMKSLKWLSVAASIGMIFVLIGGALVTKTESGAGCGKSWPLCNGQFIPSEITFELVIELSHRLVSGGVGIIVVVLSYLAWKKIGHIREVKFLSVLSVFFLVLQGLIGAAAVKWGQSDFVLALHFGISLISFAAVLLLTLLIFEIDKKFDAKALLIKKKHRIEIYLLTIYTLCVVYTGALVRHAGADLVCKDWPFCTNETPFAFLTAGRLDLWIQMGHRLAAGILFIWTILFTIKMYKHYHESRVMKGGAIILGALIVLQVFFGAMIIATMLNLAIALLHALVISCYFGLLSYFILLASRSAAQERQAATIAAPSTEPVPIK
ncbi:heme A synthase [Ornithinibacillus gellani]|uniref:COX15/CtaA family protein n=1 Tax=Ornithinibacillus gellani TaxID=2293253 RepID=UPI000F47F592|nr:heme A synthase [Ornithinibacillus gellani]TQS75686.1 heme A synthase [Ornithinibacillus gellani]